MNKTEMSILPVHRRPINANRFKHGITPLRDLRFDRKTTPSSLLSKISHFFQMTWLEWLTTILIGVAAGGISLAPGAFTRLIPVTSPSSDIYWPEIAYPYVDPIFSSLLAGVLAAAIPVSVMPISQLWVRSFDDLAYGVLGLVYSLTTGSCFQVVLKKTIGGLRPHFLAVCQPVIPPIGKITGAGFANTMWTVEQMCTGDPQKIRTALESFPSGHSEAVFAGFGYLAIYLFARLQIRSIGRNSASHWRMLFVVAPLLLATYLASTLVLTYHHHSYDVLFGALIGWVMAFFGYRLVFRSVWNPRWNTTAVARSAQGNEEEDSIEMLAQSGQPSNEGVTAGGARASSICSPERKYWCRDRQVEAYRADKAVA